MEQSFMETLISSWLPFLVLIGVYIFFMRQIKSGKALSNPQLTELQSINATLQEISKKLDKYHADDEN